MSKYPPQVFVKMLSQCERSEDGCLTWKLGLDEFGNPIMPTKRFKNATIRQDVILYQEGYPEHAPIDPSYLIHTCDNRQCLNIEHMEYLTDPDDRVEYDRFVATNARSMLAAGMSESEVMSKTGLSPVRINVLKRHALSLKAVNQ